jgi:hypothetical protein
MNKELFNKIKKIFIERQKDGYYEGLAALTEIAYSTDDNETLVCIINLVPQSFDPMLAVINNNHINKDTLKHLLNLVHSSFLLTMINDIRNPFAIEFIIRKYRDLSILNKFIDKNFHLTSTHWQLLAKKKNILVHKMLLANDRTPQSIRDQLEIQQLLAI